MSKKRSLNLVNQRLKSRQYPLFIPNIPIFHHSIIPLDVKSIRNSWGVKSKPGPPGAESLLIVSRPFEFNANSSLIDFNDFSGSPQINPDRGLVYDQNIIAH